MVELQAGRFDARRAEEHLDSARECSRPAGTRSARQGCFTKRHVWIRRCAALATRRPSRRSPTCAPRGRSAAGPMRSWPSCHSPTARPRRRASPRGGHCSPMRRRRRRANAHRSSESCSRCAANRGARESTCEQASRAASKPVSSPRPRAARRTRIVEPHAGALGGGRRDGERGRNRRARSDREPAATGEPPH